MHNSKHSASKSSKKQLWEGVRTPILSKGGSWNSVLANCCHAEEWDRVATDPIFQDKLGI